MTLTELAVFAFALTKLAVGPDGVETPYVASVHERTDTAAEAVHSVWTDGYVLEKGKPAIRPKPLFEVTDSLSYEEAIEKSEKLTLAVAWHESGMTPTAHNDGGDVGLLQTKVGYINKVAPGKTVDDVKSDIRLGVFVGVQVLHLHRDMCIAKLNDAGIASPKFNARFWLGAYASGWCGKAPKTALALCGPGKEGLCSLK